MKRHEGLHPLSREHHPALVIAKRLRRLPIDAGPAECEAAADALLAFWDEDLRAHFRKEEDTLLPILARGTRPDLPEIVETLVQHVRIRAALDDIVEARTRGGGVDAGRLAAFGELVREHVRFEEAELFPATESRLSEVQLKRIRAGTGAKK